MTERDRQRHPLQDPRNRPSQWLLMAMAVGIAIVVTLFGGAVLYIAEVFRARPLGM